MTNKKVNQMKKLIPLLAMLIAPPVFSQCAPLTTSSMQCLPSGTVTIGFGLVWNSTKTGVQNGATTSGAGAFVGIAGNSSSTSSNVAVTVYLPGNDCNGGCSIAFDGAPSSSGNGFIWSTSTGGQMHDLGSANCNAQCIGYTHGTSASSNAGYLIGFRADAVPATAETSCAALVGANGYIWNSLGTSGAFGCTLPTAIGGTSTGGSTQQYCIGNGANSSRTASTGVITVTAASGDFIRNVAGTFGSTGGTEVSSGASADLACFVSMQANQWQFFSIHGTWTP